MLEDYKQIKQLVIDGYEVSYKKLFISQIKHMGIEWIQVHCDRSEIEYSSLYKPVNVFWAVNKFIGLKAKYSILEIKNGERDYGLS